MVSFRRFSLETGAPLRDTDIPPLGSFFEEKTLEASVARFVLVSRPEKINRESLDKIQ